MKTEISVKGNWKDWQRGRTPQSGDGNQELAVWWEGSDLGISRLMIEILTGEKKNEGRAGKMLRG